MEHAPMIWLLEDDQDAADVTRAMLEQRYTDVRTFQTIEDFLKAWDTKDRPPAVLLLDLHIGARLSFDLITSGRIQVTDATALVLVSAHGDEATFLHALDYGAEHCVSKPFDAWQLYTAITKARMRCEERRFMHLKDHLNGTMERQLVEELRASRGKPVERETLTSRLWPTGARNSANLDMLIKRVREKAETAGFSIECVEAGTAIGWVLVDAESRMFSSRAN
jgi:DNA-binding response OmpR family regulator